VTANALIGVALIGYVREQVPSGPVDRAQVSGDVRRRGQAALKLLREGLGHYALKR
jgi:hypothetical protein